MPGRSVDDEPREDLATLTVERMDGLRIDRLELRLVTLDEGSDDASGTAGEEVQDHG